MTAIAARDAWDECADAYAAQQDLWTPIEDLTRATLAVARGERVLDVGCGPGALAARLAGDGARVTAVDVSPRMIELARTRARSAGVVVDALAMDAERLDLPDASFDAVASSLTFHLLPNPALAAREAARVLAARGRILVATWAPPRPGSPSEALLSALAMGEPPESTSARDALSVAGLTSVQERVATVRLAAPREAWIASFLDASPLRTSLGDRAPPLARRLRAALAPHADHDDEVAGDVDIVLTTARRSS